MAPKRVQIRIVLDPSLLQLVTRARKHMFQHIQSLLDIPELRINAGCIILKPDIVRIDSRRFKGIGAMAGGQEHR